MSKPVVNDVVIRLEYTGGTDEPERGIYQNYPVDPAFTDELLIAIRSDRDPMSALRPEGGGGIQVHLVGTARALESLGRYLVALARLETADPEPYGSFDDVRNADGGIVRLLPRRTERLP